MFESIIFSHADLETRNLVYEALAGRGYKITTAPTNNDLWKMLDKMRPDYIFIDPGLSDMAAEILAEKIKTIDANIKTVILDTKGKTLPFIIEGILKTIQGKAPAPAVKEKYRIQFQANILVVDNEKECVELVKNFLSRRGFNVDIALSGEEAILKVKTTKPDIVLLDIYMGGIDGLIVLKEIKDIDKCIIVIMTSSLADEKVIRETKKLGADGYLVKPFNLELLEKIVVENAIKKCTP